MPTKVKNGRFRVQIYLGNDENGKRMYKSFYADTKQEAEYLALTFKMGAGRAVDVRVITVRAAIDAYIKSKEGLLSPTTIQGYRSVLKNLDDQFLACNIHSLSRLSLQTQVNRFAHRNKFVAHNGEGPLSPKTVRNMYGLVSAALRQQDVRIDGITLPRKRKVEYATPFEEELTAIFRALEGTSLEIPALLAAVCSLRKSEILGLRYGDIENGILHIRRAMVRADSQNIVKDPKTYASVRDVVLPAYIEQKIAAARGDRGRDDYIVTLSPSTLNGYFHERLVRAGLKPCRFHDLRHSFVSILKAHNINPDWIQLTGGWSEKAVMNENYWQVNQKILRAISQEIHGVFSEIMQPSATTPTAEPLQKKA